MLSRNSLGKNNKYKFVNDYVTYFSTLKNTKSQSNKNLNNVEHKTGDKK